MGSSSTRQFTPRPARTARPARVRSPGERVRVGRRTCSAPSPNLASRVRASPDEVMPVASRKASSSGVAPSRSRRAWSTSPITTPGPSRCRPAASGTRPSRASSRVDLPAPFGPTMAMRSAHRTSRSTGPSVNSPRSTTAPSRVATTCPLRAASAISKCNSQLVRGLSGASASRRWMAFSDCRTLPACFSVRSLRKFRRNLSLSRRGFLFRAMTPWSDHCRWRWARSVSVRRLVS